MDKHEQIRDLIPAFSLDCLDPAEAEIVAAHLEKCALCREEFNRSLELVGKLALATPQMAAPAEVKERIFSAIHPIAQPKSEIQSAIRLQPTKPESRWSKFIQRALPAWGALSLLLIAVLSISNLRLAQRISQLEQSQPGFQTVQMLGTEFSPGAQGLLVISPDGQNGSLVVDQMPPLKDDQDYQLWLIKSGIRTSGGVFHSYADGYGVLWIHSDEPLISFEEIEVTVEPSGGSPAPSSDKIITGKIR